jgi:hypothetical protein
MHQVEAVGQPGIQDCNYGIARCFWQIILGFVYLFCSLGLDPLSDPSIRMREIRSIIAVNPGFTPRETKEPE